MTVGKRTSNTLETLRKQCLLLARELAPAQADRWIDDAEPFLRHTAEAMNLMASSSLSPMTEPAFMLTADGDARIAQDAGSGETQSMHSHPEPVRSLLKCLTVVESAQAIHSGDLSPVELVEVCLARIEATEGDVKAWDTIVQEQALDQAKQAAKALRNGSATGPLHGIPFGIKDNIFTRGIRTRGGSRLYDNHIPSYDAEVVDRLKRAGAIVLGKTTTAEMALGDPPPTCNPWNPAHTPGGSSSGSAAAVAAGHIPFALATQTGGSLNRPAGYCGLTALKPTYDLIPRHGLFPVSWTMDHIGIMTRCARDQAFIFESLGYPVNLTGDLKCLRGMKIGRPDRYFFDTLHPAQQAAYEQLLHMLKSEYGMIIKEIKLPQSFEAAVAAHTIIMQCEAATFHAQALREKGELIRPALRSRILCGYATSSIHYIRAQQVRTIYAREFHTLFHDIDILATPTSPTPAPAGIHWAGSSAFNSPFTVTGFPTIVFPTGLEARNNLPLSAQLIAPPHHEGRLLDVGMAYQKITDWHTHLPPRIKGEIQASVEPY